MDTELKQNSKAFTEKIKAALDIIQVVEKTVPLHKESEEWYAGATSQNSQSGKSLKVNCREQWYKNFASGDGGDVLDWIAFANNLDVTQDFPEVLKIAADLAGIPFEVSENDKQFAEEARIVQDTLTQAAEIYHSNLTPIIRAYINKKWGISDSTIDALKIGYASTSYDIMGRFDIELLKQTGLLVKVGDTFKEHFTGRVVFPYWSNGKVVNFAARGDKDFLGTPDNKYEEAKYKKLLVHNDRHSYVHSSVNNRYIFGEDTIRKQDFCVITEGIADSIVLIQNGYPVLSPVTVQFSEKDIDNLIHAAKRLKTVYICNDNEDSGAGEKGAIKTALLLKNIGVDVKITLLPKENLSKMDVAEYFLRHTQTEFEAVKNNSDDVLVFLLNKVPVSKNADISKSKTENMQNAVTFVKNTLTKIQNEDDAAFFIRNNIKNYFPKFTNDDIRALTKIYKNSVAVSTEEENKKILFDLDSVSGRNAVYRFFTDEYIKNHKVICINNKLRKYQNGIYPDSDENIDLVKTEIMQTGLDYNVNLAANNIDAIVKLIETSTRVKLEDCEPDSEKIVVCNNGILNLYDFSFKEFNPDQVYFSKINTDYNPNADTPTTFLDFINMVMKDNPDKIPLLQEVMGYTLLKSYKYQVFIYLTGNGGNGKGTFLSLIREMIGSQNISAESLYQLTDHQQVDYHVAKLYKKFVNLCGDIGCTKINNTETIKKLTSNTDPITARNVRERPFDFINYAKLIFAMNRVPETDAFTRGDKRRLCLIPFDNPISETDAEIKDLHKVIKDKGEMPGVLNWALEGLLRLERHGKFSDKRTVAEKGFEYELKSSPARYFIEECLEEAPGYFIPNDNMNEAFTRFCKTHHAAELSGKEIKQKILFECADAGWRVSNKLVRKTSLPKSVQDTLKELEFNKESLRCYTDVKFVVPKEQQQQQEPKNVQINLTETLKPSAVTVAKTALLFD